MDRLSPKVTTAYWKISAVVLVFITLTSGLSVKCYENQTLPRKHVLKLTEMLRKAAEHSIRASQDSQPVTAFTDTSIAKCAIDTVAQMLTPDQIKRIANVDIAEMQDFVSQQHEAATQALLKIYVEKKLGDRLSPVGSFRL